MHKIAAAIVLLLSLIVGATLPVAAQQQASPDPGVNPVRLLDRNDIRVTRVELAAGAVRSVHAHDDVEYHVWAPIGGTLEITIEQGTPTAAKPRPGLLHEEGNAALVPQHRDHAGRGHGDLREAFDDHRGWSLHGRANDGARGDP
jgi:hypothetical protein